MTPRPNRVQSSAKWPSARHGKSGEQCRRLSLLRRDQTSDAGQEQQYPGVASYGPADLG
jgi:hypothetical protein